MRAVLLVAMLAAPAAADDFCRGHKSGAPIELDVKDADLHDVFRLIADVAKINLVVSDEVAGKLTLKLRRVPWETAACAIAKVEHLVLTRTDDVLLVTKR